MSWTKVDPKIKCKHIWVQKAKYLGDHEDKGKIRYDHICPKCHIKKTTIRKVYPLC